MIDEHSTEFEDPYAKIHHELHVLVCTNGRAKVDPDNSSRWIWGGTENMEKRTPDQWCEEYGVDILDPDGWREEDSPAWDEPITLVDFHRRVSISTARVMGRTSLVRDVMRVKKNNKDLEGTSGNEEAEA